MQIFYVGSHQFRRSGSCSENCGSRIAQVVGCHSENGISYSENGISNSESCSENTPELSESSENGLFTPRAFFLKLGWSPGFWLLLLAQRTSSTKKTMESKFETFLSATDPPPPLYMGEIGTMWQIGVLTGKPSTFLVKNRSFSAFWHYKNKERFSKGLDVKWHIPSTCLDASRMWFSTGISSIKRTFKWLYLKTRQSPQNGQNVHRFQVRTPICHIVPVSRAYPPLLLGVETLSRSWALRMISGYIFNLKRLF